MSSELHELGVVKVATPCKAKWSQMKGSDTVRHCAQCNKNVYHLSRLTSFEARELLHKTEGRLCVRFFARADGTVLTQDCPVGVQRRRLTLIAAVTTVVGLLLSALASTLQTGGFLGTSSRLKAFISGHELTPADLQLRAQSVDTLEGKRMMGFGSNNAY
ncbi:MAG: hypothetical protein QM723_22225 [Myxococcaceae bacterium]